MLVLGINLGHDGGICAIKDRQVLFCLESEKDSFPRHSKLTPMSIVDALERIAEPPDVVAIAGTVKESWWYRGGNDRIEAGYYGGEVLTEREGTFCGMKLPIISTSHVRTHVMGAAGMAPPDDAKQRAVLVWEGYEGSFYLLDERWEIVREIPVLKFPGGRYAFLFGLAEPSVPDNAVEVHTDLAGKLMALAGFAEPSDADADVTATVDRLMARPGMWEPKGQWTDSPLYNVGVEAEVTKAGAALLQQRIFDIFNKVAQEELPRDIPLYIAGGCGLNCDWNTMWRETGQFSSVFIPPCPNDSGSALGTALDALHAKTGDPRVEWDVYCGEEFDWDRDPDSGNWQRRPMQYGELADALASGRVFAWVQGRWELGPRALGNRSLIANPFDPATRDLLNEIKQRETYRPIAPVARMEDVPKVFDRHFEDPYMLHFRMVTSPDLGAITHVDGSARVQTVTQETNRTLHDLLSAFAERHGVGVLCNTSLNFKRMGFINRMSDLTGYCETRGVSDFVVGDAWYQRVGERAGVNGTQAGVPASVSG